MRHDPSVEVSRIAELLGLDPGANHLTQALTHASFANERRDAEDNQRLEFLGDAVLGFCVSEYLWERYPEADEGALTRLRAKLVNATALGEWAQAHDLASALYLGRGADAANLGSSINVLADAVEALIAAAYLDGGLDLARSVCLKILADQLAAISPGSDPKSDLQERVQALRGEPPVYRVVASGGPAHERWFRIEVCVGQASLGSGEGRSKRSAERAAAEAALAAGTWRELGGDAPASTDAP
jgi:ribonuclease-3